MHEEGLLESCILSPDTVKRDLIIGYKLSDIGTEQFQEKRMEMLKEMASSSINCLITGDGTPEVDREGLIALMCDEFQIDNEARESMVEPLATRELIAVLTCHYIRSNADDMFDREHEELVVNLLQRTRLKEPFVNVTASTRIHTAIQKQLEQQPENQQREQH